MSISLLAIETSTDACSIALLHNDHISSRYEVAPRRHTSLILPMCADLLQEAQLPIEQLSAIAFGYGPGSFTGLRLAAGVTQGLAFAHQLPVIPVSSLRALAQAAYRQYGFTKVLAGFDARMQEIYWGEYILDEAQLMRSISPDKLIEPEQINLANMFSSQSHTALSSERSHNTDMNNTVKSNNASRLNNTHKWVGVGSAWASYHDILLQRCEDYLEQVISDCYPSAEAVVQCALSDYLAGKTISAAQATPVYLRDKVVKNPVDVKSQL